MPNHINLRYLSYFVAAADLGSMTRAADELHVSQSAVSQALSELERQLNVTLFFRRRALGVSLTAAGKRVHVEARSLLAAAENLVAGARDTEEVLTGTLALGCAQTLAPFLMPGIIRGFSSMHPEIELQYEEGKADELQKTLRSGRCEAAILYDMNLEPDIHHEALYRVRPYLILGQGHPLTELEEVPVSALSDHDMVMLNFPESENFASSLIASAGATPRIRYRSSNFEMVRALVASGFGFGILHQRPASNTSYEGLPIVTRPLAGRIREIDVVLATAASGGPTRRVQALAEYCRENLTPSQALRTDSKLGS